MTHYQENIMPDFCSRRTPFHYTTALNTLAKVGVDISRVDILAVGEYENYKGEVRAQHPQPGTAIDSHTRVVLEIGYPSPVDYMPYQFFYGLHGLRSTGADWEDGARRLMAPFDAMVIKYNTRAVNRMLTYDGCIIDEDYLLLILALFGFDGGEYIETAEELLFWASLLPSFNIRSGNPKAVEAILKYITGFEFKIAENTEKEYDIPHSLRYHLGSKLLRLGAESIIGRSYRDRDSCYDVIIKGVDPRDVTRLMPGKPLRKKLEWILSCTMPGLLDYRIVIKVAPSKTIIGKESAACYLGISSFVRRAD
jgi:hypothetical protein